MDCMSIASNCCLRAAASEKNACCIMRCCKAVRISEACNSDLRSKLLSAAFSIMLRSCNHANGLDGSKLGVVLCFCFSAQSIASRNPSGVFKADSGIGIPPTINWAEGDCAAAAASELLAKLAKFADFCKFLLRK